MLQFFAEKFWLLSTFLQDMQSGYENARNNLNLEEESLLPEESRTSWNLLVSAAAVRCHELGLVSAEDHLERMTKALQDESTTVRQFFGMLPELQNRIADQLKHSLILFVPGEFQEHYRSPLLFGETVEQKFPSLSYEIAEAGKCLALGRSTATVFHLMRIMETGTQQLGASLEIAFTNRKEWHPILDEAGRKIKAMDPKAPGTIAISTVVSHLYNVKVAWRNPTMHPKAVYTEEEAKELFDHVRTFMKHLAEVI